MNETVIGSLDPAFGSVAQEEERIYRKVTLRIVPFLFICYLAAYLDRVNVGFAKLQMLHDLNFSETVYGLGAGIFFLGYVLFEVPSNVIMLRVGARLWIARIMITWGIISALMVMVHSPASFYILRFLLGVAEAGFIPGILLYLTYWYPARRRGKITAIFLAAIPTATIIGGPLSGAILNAVGSGAWGFAGWQWLFIIETIPSIILGVVTLTYLDGQVERARWLTEEEKRVVMSNIGREEQEKVGHSDLSEAFTNTRVWLLGLIYFGIASGIYIISFWLPTIIKQTGVANPLSIGLLTAIPYVVAIIAMVLVNASGDRMRERRWHTIVPTLACAFGLILTAWAAQNTLLAMLGLTLAAAGASSGQASFWCIPAAFLGGAAAAAGIALVNSLGNISGFVSTFLVGWITDLAGSTGSALYFFAALVATCGLLILTVPGRDVNK
ncbi:MAG: MFS transporter [Acetobacteraceae bacterium]|nr:MFS transporter [Acetobacteraceae bacterium]